MVDCRKCVKVHGCPVDGECYGEEAPKKPTVERSCDNCGTYCPLAHGREYCIEDNYSNWKPKSDQGKEGEVTKNCINCLSYIKHNPQDRAGRCSEDDAKVYDMDFCSFWRGGGDIK